MSLLKNVLLLLITTLTACLNPATRLPAKRQADFVLTYHLDGGMQYYAEDLYISQDSCVFTKNDGGQKTKKHFMLSAQELDDLYDFLRNKKIDYIEYRSEKEVYDRGGISIELSWGKDTGKIRISDAQRDFVKEKWQKNWNEICTHLLETVARKS